MPAAFASHLLLDVLTHEDPLDEDGRFRPAILALDVFCTTAALLVLARRHGMASGEVVGALAACLPDGEHFVLRGRKQVSLHGLLPHSLWPRVSLSLREQFVIAILAGVGVVALLPRGVAGARSGL